MDQVKNIGWVTLLLSAVAGYCDTATFVAGDSIFSAHVTGNFIVFAAQVLFSSEATAWYKLLTFPVFVLAVMTGGWLAERRGKKNMILLIESLLLVVCGIVAWSHAFFPGVDVKLVTYGVVMSVVFAMGLQNTYGKLFPKDTYGPTTMMTGNVTQFALDLGAMFRKKFQEPLVLASFKKGLTLIAGFLLGCLLGALVANKMGLAAVILPGVAMAVCYAVTTRKNSVVAH